MSDLRQRIAWALYRSSGITGYYESLDDDDPVDDTDVRIDGTIDFGKMADDVLATLEPDIDAIAEALKQSLAEMTYTLCLRPDVEPFDIIVDGDVDLRDLARAVAWMGVES